MASKTSKDVDQYIKTAAAEARPILQELRQLIKSVVPKAEESIRWNVPMYQYHGILAGYDAAKHHVSFGVDVLGDEDREKLTAHGYKTGSKTVQIKFGQKIPVLIIKKLLKAQAKENEKSKKAS